MKINKFEEIITLRPCYCFTNKGGKDSSRENSTRILGSESCCAETLIRIKVSYIPSILAWYLCFKVLITHPCN